MLLYYCQALQICRPAFPDAHHGYLLKFGNRCAQQIIQMKSIVEDVFGTLYASLPISLLLFL